MHETVTDPDAGHPGDSASGTVLRLDSALSEQDVDLLDRLWHSYGVRVRRSEPLDEHRGVPLGFSPDLGPRADAARNFRRTGGRFGRTSEPGWLLIARTTYFRDEYAYGDAIAARAASRA